MATNDDTSNVAPADAETGAEAVQTTQVAPAPQPLPKRPLAPTVVGFDSMQSIARMQGVAVKADVRPLDVVAISMAQQTVAATQARNLSPSVGSYKAELLQWLEVMAAAASM